MEPLDLTTRPPRSPYEKMLGFFMLPRTIDKLRAMLPGGNLGSYNVGGSMKVLPGLSSVLLEGLGITQEQLRVVVGSAACEGEVSQWLKQNAELPDPEALNRKLMGRQVEDLLAVVPLEKLKNVYPFIDGLAESTPCFDVLLEDDRRQFPNYKWGTE